MNERAPRRAATLAVLAFTLSCAGDDSGPTAPPPVVPGTVTLELVSPNGAEGAAVIDLLAAPVAAVTSGDAVVHAHKNGDRITVVLLRARPGAISAALSVRDTAAALDARIVQVADSANALRALTGYSLRRVR